MKQSIDKSALNWMPKQIWGPIKWKELHVRALADLPMTGEAEWFAAFKAGLPCPKCREHFEQYCLDYPPDFRSRAGFFIWTVNAHNHVNCATGKAEWSVTNAYAFHAFTKE